jgi:hypothetical protein
VEKRGTAYTLTPTTVVRWGTNVNWVGKPAGRQLAWNPEISAGTYTGQAQGSWSVSGNGRYLSYGGEFPRVEGVAQQGLVRFAMPALAPNKVGPVTSGFTTSVVSPAPGVARVSWRETWDHDNESLTYRVYRDSDTAAPIYTTTRTSRWWALETAGFADVGQSGSHRYRVTASDPFGNTVATAWTTFVVPAGTPGARAYVSAVRADGATDHWSLGEATGSTGYADLGGNDLVVGSGVTRGAGGAISGDPDPAATFGGTSASLTAAQKQVQAPNVFTLEAWFRTSSATGGKIIGFGNSNTGASSTYDRHVYMDAAGRVLFGVNWLNNRRTIFTGTGLNDGAYHHVVATMSGAGMRLYVDGTLRSSDATVVAGPNYYGYWRVGGDATWSGADYFTGRIDEVAVYPTALTAQQVAGHHALGTGPTNTPPSASFTQTRSGLTVTVDGSASSDPGGSVARYAWDFGDGSPVVTGTSPTASHTYASGGTRTVTLTVTDGQGATGSTAQSVTVTAPAGPAVLAGDAFGRTVTGGLGTADTGGAWTASAGASRQSVTPGVAEMRLDAANQNTGSYLGSVAQTSTDVRTSFSLSSMPTGSGTYVYVTGRRVGNGQEYRVRVRVQADGRVALTLSRLSGTETFPGGEIVVPGVTYTAGSTLQVRVQVFGTGTTQIRASVWAGGTAEPATPSMSRTDTTAALQAPGGIGLAVHRPSGTTVATAVRFGAVTVTAGS